jgi:glucose-6-phosphate dehydrogenase assembly protein OpcA
MNKQEIDIQIPNIEKELDLQWSLQKKDYDTKASLFTLIIYAQDKRRVSYLQELVNSILDKFPCRIIFIQREKESTSSYFRIHVSSITSKQQHAKGSSNVRCDQIVIESSHDQLFRAPFLVIPNIVPDLPVYLLWGQNPFEEKNIFPYVQKYAKRVIFDSECADDLKLFFKEMQLNLDTLKMDVMDINWAIAGNWRDIICELFESPEKVENLKASKSIIVQYNDCQTKTNTHPEIRALYLQGWLASALNWRFQNVERFDKDVILSYFGPIHPVIIALSPQTDPHLPAGSLIGVEITTTTGSVYSLSRKENLQKVLVHSSSKDACELPYTLSLSNYHKGLAFMKEIFFGKLGCHYRETLKAISKIDLKIFSKN